MALKQIFVHKEDTLQENSVHNLKNHKPDKMCQTDCIYHPRTEFTPPNTTMLVAIF